MEFGFADIPRAGFAGGVFAHAHVAVALSAPISDGAIQCMILERIVGREDF
jgi:hypothetical protein